jgi:hypothetical protein
VDFAWGNFPLQPNTERSADISVSTAVLAYADEKAGNQRFTTIYATLPDAFVAGATVEIAGFSNPKLNGLFTIESTFEATFKTTAAYIATEYSSSPGGNQTAAVDPSNNVGGGAGDKYWSKTTKKKSVLLDPALDNHVLATNGWNGYPGYNPGSATPPALGTFTVSLIDSLGMFYSPAYFTSGGASYDGMQQESRARGLTFRITAPALGTNGQDWDSIINDWDVLSAAVTEKTLSGRKITINGDLEMNYMGAPLTTYFNDKELDLLGGWLASDSYGVNHLVLTMALPEDQDLTSGGMGDMYNQQPGVEFSFTISASRTTPLLTFNQVDDYSPQYGMGAGYDAIIGFMNWSSYESGFNIYAPNATPEQLAVLSGGSLLGKSIGFGSISATTAFNSYLAGAQSQATLIGRVLAVSQQQDNYGVNYWQINVGVNAEGDSYSGFSGSGYAPYAGDQLVVLDN